MKLLLKSSAVQALLITLSALCLAPAPVFAQEVIYYHTDALGSPVAITDESGDVIERREYEPYGKQLDGSLAGGPGYTGHVSDAETGLSYMQQRYYDPGIGRFLSVDPVMANGNTGGNFNRYWYANNNTYTFVDPDGEFARGAGWSDEDWEKFDAAQQHAANALEVTASQIQNALTTGEGLAELQVAFEKNFGEGTGTAENLTAMVGNMTGMVAALRETTGNEFVANAMPFSQIQQAYPAAKASYAAFNPEGTKSLVVNLSHTALNSPVALSWIVGHESSHAALGFGDHAYKLGNNAQARAFWNLAQTNPGAALRNPDHVMNFAVKNLAKEFP